MATGYLFNRYCYPTSAQAADAYFSGSGPFHVPGATSYQSWYSKSAGNWILQRITISSTGSSTTLNSVAMVTPTFASCDTSAVFLDGMTLGWGVAAAMVAAFAVKFLSRALHR